MIPQTDISWQRSSWQELLADSIRDPKQLMELLELDSQNLSVSFDNEFPLRVPWPYLAKMERGNPNDPLLLQVLPQQQEKNDQYGYVSDPVGDVQSNHLPGLIHKYHGRVLLVASTQCAVNCRYCFRREFPYAENRLGLPAWKDTFAYIANDQTILEVILSGGDPLVIGDRQLGKFVEQLAQIPHVKRLRIHSRLPIVIPNRVTDQAIDWMTSTRLRPVIVIHCNHAKELADDVRCAIEKLNNAGLTVLNQSVLLKGVNDSVNVLEELCSDLYDYGVLPYYLHVMDKVKGAAHFDIDSSQAVELIEALRARLPGYLVPRLVQDVAGMPFKQILG